MAGSREVLRGSPGKLWRWTECERTGAPYGFAMSSSPVTARRAWISAQIASLRSTRRGRLMRSGVAIGLLAVL